MQHNNLLRVHRYNTGQNTLRLFITARPGAPVAIHPPANEWGIVCIMDIDWGYGKWDGFLFPIRHGLTTGVFL